MSDHAFDPACLKLAALFLPDDATYQRKCEIAQAIQDAIENKLKGRRGESIMSTTTGQCQKCEGVGKIVFDRVGSEKSEWRARPAKSGENSVVCNRCGGTGAGPDGKHLGERDPRIDPMPGDVLRRGNRMRTVYTEILPLGPKVKEFDWVSFQTASDIKFGNVTQERPEIWRKWAATAEIVKKAEG